MQPLSAAQTARDRPHRRRAGVTAPDAPGEADRDAASSSPPPSQEREAARAAHQEAEAARRAGMERGLVPLGFGLQRTRKQPTSTGQHHNQFSPVDRDPTPRRGRGQRVCPRSHSIPSSRSLLASTDSVV